MDLLIPSDWPQIIGHDHAVYWTLAVAVPKFGRSTLTTQAYWRGHFTKAVVCDNPDGTKNMTWYLADKIHRDDDEPARLRYTFVDHLQRTVFVQSWYKFGKEHREGDKPAVIYEDYSQEWRQNGKLHRDGGLPVIVYADGTSPWHLDGDLRVQRIQDLPRGDQNKPAIIGADDQSEWWKNCQLVKANM